MIKQKKRNPHVSEKKNTENWNKMYRETIPDIVATIKSSVETTIEPDLNEESPASCK